MRAGTLLAATGGLAAPAPARDGAAGTAWQPTFEPQDAWMDIPGTRHRMMFDTSSAAAASAAIAYAGNYYEANHSGYGLAPASLGVIIVLRHFSTVFGFDDRIWAKYGAIIADKMKLEGDQAVRAVRGNPLLPAKPHGAKSDDEATLAGLAAKGARFAVCGIATEGTAAVLAKATGATAKAVGDELRSGLIAGAVLVPAGIVAVDRAQEHGYSFALIAG